MPARPVPALDRAGRRRALRSSAVAVGAVGLTDVVLSGGTPARVAVWLGWVALFLLASALVERGPGWVTHAIGFVTSSAAVAALMLLAAAGDGTRSLYFLLAVTVPVLSVTFSPDDMLDAAVQGVVVLGAGLALQIHEGLGAERHVLFAVVVAVVTGAAIHASLGHRRRVAELLEERALASAREVELERERQRADRLHAIGKLAEGVAHDVNSPLGSLRSNLAFVREEIAAGRGGARDVAEAIEDSAQALERIRETVASLRAISVEAEPPGAAAPGGAPPEASPRPVRRG